MSRRDLEVLEFVARYGLVTRGVVAAWAGTGATVTWTRERRLCQAGLLRTVPTYEDGAPLLLCTRRGLLACGRTELGLARFSEARAHHSVVAAMLGAELELAGARVLSEREIFARERLTGERIYSAPLRNGRYHSADLVRLGDAIEAIEVELTPKAPRRLDELVRAWRRAIVARRIGRVVYRCSPEVLEYVKRAIERTRAQSYVIAEPL